MRILCLSDCAKKESEMMASFHERSDDDEEEEPERHGECSPADHRAVRGEEERGHSVRVGLFQLLPLMSLFYLLIQLLSF